MVYGRYNELIYYWVDKTIYNWWAASCREWQLLLTTIMAGDMNI